LHEAEKFWLRSLRNGPNLGQTVNLLKAVCERMGQMDKFDRAVLEISSHASASNEALVEACRIRLSRADPADAAQLLKRALSNGLAGDSANSLLDQHPDLRKYLKGQ